MNRARLAARDVRVRSFNAPHFDFAMCDFFLYSFALSKKRRRHSSFQLNVIKISKILLHKVPPQEKNQRREKKKTESLNLSVRILLFALVLLFFLLFFFHRRLRCFFFFLLWLTQASLEAEIVITSVATSSDRRISFPSGTFDAQDTNLWMIIKLLDINKHRRPL